jgi:REP-associated tyrosine transposase
MGLYYHVWFSTKGRKDAFEGELSDEIKAMLIDIARTSGIHLVEMELVADHAHLLIGVAERQSLPGVMHQLKGASARFIFLKYPELKIDMRSKSFWQKGYGQRWVPRDQIEIVRRYIGTQRDRPYRRAN